MKGIFIHKITKEGARKIVNVPKEKYEEFDFGDDVIVKKVNAEDMLKN